MRGLGSMAILLAIAGGTMVAAMAGAARLEAQVTGTSHFRSVDQLSVSSHGIIAEGNLTPASYAFEAEKYLARIINAPKVTITYHAPLVGERSYYYNEDAYFVENVSHSGRISLTEPAPTGSVRVLPLNPDVAFSLATTNLSLVDVGLPAPGRQFLDPLERAGELLGRSVHPDSSKGILSLPSGTLLNTSGALFIVHWGVVVRLEGLDREIWTGDRRNDSRSFKDPSGSMRVDVVDRITMVVVASGARADVGDASGLSVFPRDARIASHGEAWIVGARGVMNDHGEDTPVAGALVKFLGTVDSAIEFESTERGLSSEGGFEWLEVDGQRVALSSTPTKSSPPVGVAVATGLAALLVLVLSKFGGRLLAFLGWSRTSPLVNPVRRQIVELIGSCPGIGQLEIAQRLGRRDRRYARYHLATLVRHGVIVAVRYGNRNTFVLNGKATLPQAGSSSLLPAQVLSVASSLSHPRRRIIFTILSEMKAASFEQLQDRWVRQASFGPCPTQSTFGLHARHLERAGLIRRTRRGREIIWSIDERVASQIETRGLELQAPANRLTRTVASPTP